MVFTVLQACCGAVDGSLALALIVLYHCKSKQRALFCPFFADGFPDCLNDYIKNRRPNNFPPGPMAMPFVGNMFSVDFNKAHENLTQLSEKYGDVYSLRLGSTWNVVVNRLKTLKEALVIQGDSLADRPMFALQEEVSPNQGIILTNGHMWKQQRRFAIFTLKNLGVGKKSLESAIVDENTYLSNEIAEYKGRPFNPHILINNAVSNIICSLVFGHRFDYDDEKFVNLLKWMDTVIQIEGSIWAEMYNSFPALMKYVPGPHQTAQTIYKNMMEFMRSEIEKHKEDWDPSEPRDYTDCYLTEIQKSKGDADAEANFYDNNLATCALDLFVAGSETTSTTLRWGLLYMAMYPRIQEKVQAEIDRSIGQSRQPSMADRANLPYTDAVIHEIQRMGNIVPLSIPHMTTRDVQLGGYTVPKGVTIIPNLTSALFDKDEWETPLTFNPGHFLNEEGEFVKRASFIPFSAGKRVCLGENLARMELFLFFVCLMQKFSFSVPAGVKAVLDYRFGFTLAPVSYEICATERQA